MSTIILKRSMLIRTITLSLAFVFMAVFSPLSASAQGSEATALDLSQPGVIATLNGQVIPMEEIVNHYCTDVTYPEITCFAEESALKEFVYGGSLAGGSDGGTSPLCRPDMQTHTGCEPTYAILYDYPNYTGGAFYAKYTYSNLGSWRNRASSARKLLDPGYCVYTSTSFNGSAYCPRTDISQFNSAFNNNIESMHYGQ